MMGSTHLRTHTLLVAKFRLISDYFYLLSTFKERTFLRWTDKRENVRARLVREGCTDANIY